MITTETFEALPAVFTVDKQNDVRIDGSHTLFPIIIFYHFSSLNKSIK